MERILAVHHEKNRVALFFHEKIGSKEIISSAVALGGGIVGVDEVSKLSCRPWWRGFPSPVLHFGIKARQQLLQVLGP
jgi:hypothetical protein